MSSKITLAYDDAPFPTSHWRKELVLFVNGKRYEESDVDPHTTLLEWLRSKGLTGTKLGCSEGGCGACTVMVSKADASSGVRHAAVNACLMPVCAADWCAVTTVEGIGDTRKKGKGLHPVQERLTLMHGSQCGFCTPGIVMSIYSLLRQSPGLTMAEMQEHLDGNLCRCTGYRPILDAARSLCSDAPCAEHGCAQNGCAAIEEGGGCGEGGCCGERKYKPDEPADPTGKMVGGDVLTASEDKLAHFERRYQGYEESEPPFPAELAAAATPPPLRVSSAGVTWWRPGTLDELLQLKRAVIAALGARTRAG